MLKTIFYFCFLATAATAIDLDALTTTAIELDATATVSQ